MSNLDTKDIDYYYITGYYYNTTKRFKSFTVATASHAMNINLWKGSVWAVLKTGKRKLLKRV